MIDVGDIVRVNETSLFAKLHGLTGVVTEVAESGSYCTATTIRVLIDNTQPNAPGGTWGFAVSSLDAVSDRSAVNWRIP